MRKLFMLFALFFAVITQAYGSQGRVLDLDFHEAISFAQDDKGRLFNFPHHVQHTEVWCWAATSAMVLSYRTGQNIEDCEVLSHYFGTNCCYSSRQCTRPGNDFEIATLLSFGNVRTTTIGRALNFDELAKEIGYGNPLILKMRSRSSNIGHVVVVSGYYPNGTIVLNDPMNYHAITIPYQALFQYTNGLSWIDTFIIR